MFVSAALEKHHTSVLLCNDVEEPSLLTVYLFFKADLLMSIQYFVFPFHWHSLTAIEDNKRNCSFPESILLTKNDCERRE